MTKMAYRAALTGIAAAGSIGTANATTIELTVTLPQLRVAEYHRPYVAIWLEQAGQPNIRTIAVWYDADNREGGAKWLRDLRSWWRKGGRDAAKPADAISGATRAPGPQRLRFDAGAMKPGNYVIAVEAAREDGGREVVNVPFAWNGKTATATGRGTTELGAVTATIR